MMSDYTRIEVNAETGETRVIEMTRYEWLCSRLGLAEGTSETEAEACYAKSLAALEMQEKAEADAEAILRGAAERLAAYDAGTVASMLDAIEDDEARAAIKAMNTLIADIRALILMQMGVMW